MLRALGLGDLLTGVPALRALRRGFPDHELVLAAPPVLEPLVALTGAIDRLLPASGLHPLPWYDAPPAVAVNLHGRGPQSHAVLRALAPGRLVAFGGHDGPSWCAQEHETRRWCRLVTATLGLEADPRDLLLTPPPAAAPAPGAVVVHPGAAYPSRRWPAPRFAEVAQALAGDDGHRVVVTGGPDEVGLATEVAGLAGLPPDGLLAGRTDLAVLAAQVASAALVVCGDTGVAHLATALGTPSVLLFGPVSPELWGPVTDGPHTVLWHGADRTTPGDPWGTDVDPALLAVTVAEVLAAGRARLGARAPRQAPAPR